MMRKVVATLVAMVMTGSVYMTALAAAPRETEAIISAEVDDEMTEHKTDDEVLYEVAEAATDEGTTVGGNDNPGPGEPTDENGNPIDKGSVSDNNSGGSDNPGGSSGNSDNPGGDSGSGDSGSGDNPSPAEPTTTPVAVDHGKRTVEAMGLASDYWQVEATFPHWAGAIDDTLTTNDVLAFESYKGQGYLDFSINSNVKSFDLFINGTKIKSPKASTKLNISKYTVSGRNTLRISNIQPHNISNAVRVRIPYPTIVTDKKTTPSKLKLNDESFKLIDQLVTADVAHGYTGAQLAVIKDGQLVYSKAWGYVNAYDGTQKTSEFLDKTTTETMYDIAGVSSVYTAAAIDYLASRGSLSLDDKVVDILGDEFVESTVEMDFYSDSKPELSQIKQWKSELTVDQLMRRRSGLPATGYYHKDTYIGATGVEHENPLYVSDGRKSTAYQKVLQTPMMAKPGTVYCNSDVDYILLGFIVEKVSGATLDGFIKATLLNPMGLTHTAYNPTKNGFRADICATTELTGNSRGGLVQFPGVRTDAVQGQVHDELAYYTMEGVAGHAGVFATAEDLAKFGTIFITGGYGEQALISPAVLDATESPDIEAYSDSVGGWFRRDDGYGYSWIAGATAGRKVLCSGGFTKCLLVVDPENSLSIAYCTNAIGTPITFTNPRTSTPTLATARFAGNYYISSTMGFVSELIYDGLQNTKVGAEFKSLMYDMLYDKYALVYQQDAAIHRERGVLDDPNTLLMAGDWIVQSEYALFRVANNYIGKGKAKKLALAYLDVNRDQNFLKAIYGVKPPKTTGASSNSTSSQN